MGGCADHELLRVRRHCPPCEKENGAWDEVTLGPFIAIPTEPDADGACAPPDDADHRVLPIVSHPVGAPVMLGESVDAPPDGKNNTVVEFLRSAALADPDLADKQNDGQYDAVPDKGATHDEVRSTLAKIVALAEAKSRDTSEDHLRPCEDRHGFTEY